MFFQPLFLSGIAVPEYGARPRQLPLDIGTPELIKIEYSIDIPPGMRVDSIPEKTRIQSEFGEIEIEYATAGNVLHATQTLTYTQSRISPEKYPQYREFTTKNLRLEKLRLRMVKIAP